MLALGKLVLIKTDITKRSCVTCLFYLVLFMVLFAVGYSVNIYCRGLVTVKRGNCFNNEF